MGCGGILLTGCDLFNQDNCPEQKAVDDQLAKGKLAGLKLQEDSCKTACKCEAADEIKTIFGSLDKECAVTWKAVYDAGTNFDEINEVLDVAKELLKLDECKKSKAV